MTAVSTFESILSISFSILDCEKRSRRGSAESPLPIGRCSIRRSIAVKSLGGVRRSSTSLVPHDTTLDFECQALMKVVSGMCMDSAVETVPDTADAHEVFRLGWLGFDLAAERDDMVVHHSVRQKRTWSPDSVNELLAREDSGLISDKRQEQLEFSGSGLHDRPAASQFTATCVHFHVAEAINIEELAPAGRPPEMGTDASTQLLWD